MRGIIPKNKIKGVDICGDKSYTYIIRSDLGCYMRTTDLQKGSDPTVFRLHHSCQNEDHYLADKDWFYVIKGKSFRRVKDLSTDADKEVKDLPPNLQGGDHYFTAFGWFYIIFQERRSFRITTDLSADLLNAEYELHPYLRGGLYYWGLSEHFCFLKPDSEWGIEYYEGAGFETDKRVGVTSVHPDVVNFLPGGLSISLGQAFGRWKNIKTICNDSDTPVTWLKKIVRKTGYNKEKMKEITHNFRIGGSFKIILEDLAGLIAKVHFSLFAEYGYSHVNTEKESWDEVTEVEEEITFELKPHKSLYVWEYRLGLGDEPVLFCCDINISDEPNPPGEVPQPSRL